MALKTDEEKKSFHGLSNPPSRLLDSMIGPLIVQDRQLPPTSVIAELTIVA